MDPESRVVALERVVKNTLSTSRSLDGKGAWKEIAGAWVLFPESGKPKSIVHFMGGAFIGVAPQLAYRSFLESLSERQILVIATPFSTHFDHLRSADETQYKFDAACSYLSAMDPKLPTLPVYGVGHSLGSLLHLLISSKFAVQRAGNVLMSFNNKSAPEVIPLLQQVAPAAKLLQPVLDQATPFRTTAEAIRDALRGMSPSLVQQVTPWAEQFIPLYYDLVRGNEEFTPSPQETRKRLKTYYPVRRNLLIKFNNDEVDETDILASLLQDSSIRSELDLTIRALPGNHARPMQAPVVDLPPEVSRAADTAFATGTGFIDQLSKMAADAGQSEGSAQLDRLSKGVSGMASMFKPDVKSAGKNSIPALVDEIVNWMEAGQKYLP